MLKPMTIRISEKTLKQIAQFIKMMNLDKTNYLRSIIEKGFRVDMCERILDRYEKKELSIEEAAHLLGVSQWEFFDLLKEKHKMLNIEFDDWKKSVGF